MAAYMEDWLGPLIERELKLAIEWKRCPSTTEPRGISEDKSNQASIIEPDTVLSQTPDQQRRFRSLYKSDGSNLRAIYTSLPTSKHIVQIIEVFPLLPPFSKLTAL
jgi:hypothetical protein